MIRLIQSIINSIGLFVTFLVHTITSLLTLIINIPTYIEFLLASISFMPTLVMPYIIASIALLVMLFVIGRGH